MRVEIVQQILDSYGLRPSAVLSTQKGYRNESHPLQLADGRWANLIIYKNEPGILNKIRSANRVSNYLAAHGFPARRTLDRRIVRLAAGNITKYGALYEYLPGETIPWEAYTMEHIKLLGKTMGKMHAALQRLPQPPTSLVADEYLTIIRRMRLYFSDRQVQAAITAKLGLDVTISMFDRFEAIVKLAQNLPLQQTLHMDFVRGNILFDANKNITGILDFEKTAFGSPLFDVARTLAFLLVDCKYKSPDKIRKYFLYSGYCKRGGRTISSTRLLDELVNLFLIYDFYKFLRHNPYEYLHQNEHYRRTTERLLHHRLIANNDTIKLRA